MFTMVVLTLFVGVYSLTVRIRAVRKEGLDPMYFKTYTVGDPSHRVLQAGRHFENLFEVPTLFYAGCLAAMMVGANQKWALIWAWAFVAARIVHAVIHLGSNKLFPRMGSFLFGFTAIIGLWICVILKLI